MSIIIDPEFQSLIPPLSKDEYTQLEKNIVKDGIRDALIVWPQENGNSILIDGHNRFQISAAHAGIRFEVREKNFKDRDEAKLWIIRNQKGRRNLKQLDAIALSQEEEKIVSKLAEQKMLSGTADPTKKSWEGTDRQRKRENETAYKMAKEISMSEDTYRKGKAILASDNEELIKQVRSGDVSINQGYKIVKGITQTTPQKEAKKFDQKIKERREEFKEKKESGIVDFQSIKQEQEDRDYVVNDVWLQLMKMGKNIDIIFIKSHEGEIDLKETAKHADKEKIENLINCMTRWTAELSELISLFKGVRV